jgi:hypothetical protein
MGLKRYHLNCVCCPVPIIPALKRLRQGDFEFEDSLGYIGNSRPVWLWIENQARWPMPVIPGTWEAEIRRITAEANPGKKLWRPNS